MLVRTRTRTLIEVLTMPPSVGSSEASLPALRAYSSGETLGMSMHGRPWNLVRW